MTARRAAMAAAAAAAALLAGCAVGPDYVRPAVDADVPAGYVADTAAARLDTAATDDDWWTAFGDTTLDRLVERSLRRNHDLQRATAAVLEARALLGGAEADRWPAIEVGGTATRTKSNLARFGRPGSIYVNSFEASATARYELDLWGRLARAEEAARARLLASDMNRRVVAQTLVADVVRTWLELRELQCQLGLTLHTIDSFRSTLDLVEERYARGLVPAVEVRLARQNLLTALAAEPAQRQQLADAARRLEVLTGDYPAGRTATAADAAYRDLAMPPPLPPVPAGLPSELLERRPDLVAAEARLHAATADVGQAEARLFPTISLTGSAGYSSTELGELFRPESSVWNLTGNLLMPLINRGATKAQVEAARARTGQAVADYRKSVLGAFSEVESALVAEQRQSEREAVLTRSAVEARRSLELARRRYAAGLDNLLTTLESQRRLFNTESSLLSTQRARRVARVNLILALGGPWDEAALAASLDLADGAPRPHGGEGGSE